MRPFKSFVSPALAACLLVFVLVGSACKREVPLPEIPLTEAEGTLEVVEATHPEGGEEGTFTISDLSAPPSDGDVGWWPAVAVANDGTIHLAYTDAYNGAIHHAEKVEGEWRISKVDSAGAVGKYPALILSDEGSPHVIYYNQDNRLLRHATRVGTGQIEEDDRRRPPRALDDWLYEVIDQGFEIGMAGRLLFDKDGTLHAVYYGPDQRLIHAWRVPPEPGARASWQRRMIDRDAAGSHSIVIGLAEGKDGSLHVSYSDWKVATSELRYGRLPPGGDEWEVSMVEGVDNAGWKSAVLLDEEDRPLIAYLLLKERLIFIARKEADGWHHFPLIGSANTMNFVRPPGDGPLILAYEHLPGRSLGGARVRILARADSRGDLSEGWTAQEVPGGNMSTYLAAATDSAGDPVVAFYRGDIRGVSVFDGTGGGRASASRSDEEAPAPEGGGDETSEGSE